MKNRLSIISFMAATVLLSTGCGGGGGGSNSSNNSGGNVVTTKSISGNVIDPAISGANVSLICSDSRFDADSVTNQNGEFNILNIPKDKDLSNCSLESLNGIDGGDNLQGLVLKAPYKLFGTDTGIVISPLTTLIQNYGDGLNIDDAIAKVQNITGFSHFDFSKLTKDDFKIDPTTKGDIAILSKMLTKIAMKKDSSGTLIGFLDVDGIDNNQLITDIEDYLKNVSEEERIKLNNELKIIASIEHKNLNADGLKNEIIKQSMVGSLIYELENIFKEDRSGFEYTDAENSNFEYITNKIIESLKIENTYKTVTKYHLRKALSDLELMPQFDKDGALKPDLKNILNYSKKDFESYYTSKNVDISGVKGIVIYNSATTKQILGDDNQKRVEYYTYSDKSHIGKALSILDSVYDDLILNPSYVEIAKGLAKLGYSNDAMDVVNQNIYGLYEKIQAQIDIGVIFDTQGKNAEARILLSQAADNLKEYINKKGAEYLDSNDTWMVLDIYASNFAVGTEEKANEVINYFNNEVIDKIQTNQSTAYGRVAVVFRNMIQQYLDEGEVEKARAIFLQSADFVLRTPVNESNPNSTISNILSVAHPGAILQEKTKVEELLARINTIDTQFGTNFNALTSAGQAYEKGYAVNGASIAGIKALLGDVDSMMTIFNDTGFKYYYNATNKNEQDGSTTVLDGGMLAALFIKGTEESKQKAIDLLYEYRPFKDFEASPYYLGNQIYRYYAPRVITVKLDPARQLKAYNTELMVEFYERLVADMENRPWTLDDNSIAKYVLNAKYGLPIIIEHYHSVGDYTKRDSMLSKAINIANNMSDAVHKLSAYQAIISTVDTLKLPKTSDITSLVTGLGGLVENVELNNTSKDYYNELQSVIALSKYIATYQNLDDAKVLVKKAITSLPSNIAGDKEIVEKRLRYAIGNYDDAQSTDWYKNSILSALVVTKSYKEAEILIDEINQNISTLGDSLDAYTNYRNVARAYAAINNIEKVNDTLSKIKTLKEKNQATYFAVKYLSNFDAFPHTSVAFVDTDMDGKPDFFNLIATPEDIEKSGLILDDDIDGDGILDTVDELPYFKN
ncbi:hypothetical protein CRU92_03975 [Arcobacter sp. FW59]|nr:hypothetical protein CRU92_03975 [Arcobacter sp. FW59]